MARTKNVKAPGLIFRSVLSSFEEGVCIYGRVGRRDACLRFHPFDFFVFAGSLSNCWVLRKVWMAGVAFNWGGRP